MTLHPYAPWTPGSWIKYDVYDIEGDFDPNSGYCGISKRTPHANTPQMETVVQFGDMRAVVSHLPGTPAVPGPATIHFARVGSQVGEIGGWKCAELPLIPLLDDAPAIGKTTGTCNVMHFNDAVIPTDRGVYHYQKFVHHIGQPWGPVWPDTIRTALIENKAPDPIVSISYIWARAIGPVHRWRVQKNSAGLWVGNLWAASAWGGQ